MSGSRVPAILLAAVGAVYLAVIFSSPLNAFWTIDGGFKFLTVERLAETSLRDVSIPYPGDRIDPDGEFFPIKPPMATLVGGRFVPDVSLPFPILTAPFYRVLSMPGLYLLPLLSTLVCLWLTYRLGRRYAGSWAALTIPLVGLATPVFFYAVTFWEHNLALCLTTAAVLILAGTEDGMKIKTAVAAGILLGAAVWFREECYLFAGSAILALLITRAGLRASLGSAAGCAAAILPLLLFQWRVLGRPFGKRMQGASEFGLVPEETGGGTGGGFGGYLVDRLETLYAWTLGLTQNLGVTLAVSIPFLLGLLLFLILKRRGRVLVIPWAGTTLYAILCLLVLAGTEGKVFSTYFSGGLFTTAPVIGALLAGVLATSGSSRSRGETFMVILVVLFFSSAVILSPIKYQRGVHWGPRYLLPILPILAVLGLSGVRRAVVNLERRSVVLALGVLVLALSFVVQTQGITSLQIKKSGTARTVDLFRESPPVTIVTNVWWFPLEIASAYRCHPIYTVTDTNDFHALLERFRGSGIDRFTIVASPMDDRILRDPVISVLQVRPHVNPAMGYFDLLICECGLK